MSILTPLVMVLTLQELILFIGVQTPGGVVSLVLAFLVLLSAIPTIADWLMRSLCLLKSSMRNFTT